MTTNKLKQKIVSEYKHVFWVKNYVKTITATTLVSSGVGLLLTGELTRMQNHGWSDAELILGCCCIVLALIITFVLDIWAGRKDKDMIGDIEEYIDERAEHIAEQKVLYYLDKIAGENDE